MAITQFTNIPGRGQDATQFAARADHFLGVQLPRFVTEANQTAAEINDDADQAAAAVASAGASAGMAAAAIEGLANYKGEWSTLSGPLTMPATVRHKDRFWILVAGTPNVALAEPGVDVSRWRPVQRGMIVTRWNINALHGDDIIHVNTDQRNIWLPPGPSEGDTVSVVTIGSGVTRVARNGSTILGVEDDLLIDQKDRRVRLVFVGGTWRVIMEGLAA